MGEETKKGKVCKEILYIFKNNGIGHTESLGMLEVLKHIVIKSVIDKGEYE